MTILPTRALQGKKSMTTTAGPAIFHSRLYPFARYIIIRQRRHRPKLEGAADANQHHHGFSKNWQTSILAIGTFRTRSVPKHPRTVSLGGILANCLLRASLCKEHSAMGGTLLSSSMQLLSADLSPIRQYSSQAGGSDGSNSRESSRIEIPKAPKSPAPKNIPSKPPVAKLSTKYSSATRNDEQDADKIRYEDHMEMAEADNAEEMRRLRQQWRFSAMRARMQRAQAKLERDALRERQEREAYFDTQESENESAVGARGLRAEMIASARREARLSGLAFIKPHPRGRQAATTSQQSPQDEGKAYTGVPPIEAAARVMIKMLGESPTEQKRSRHRSTANRRVTTRLKLNALKDQLEQGSDMGNEIANVAAEYMEIKKTIRGRKVRRKVRALTKNKLKELEKLLSSAREKGQILPGEKLNVLIDLVCSPEAIHEEATPSSGKIPRLPSLDEKSPLERTGLQGETASVRHREPENVRPSEEATFSDESTQTEEMIKSNGKQALEQTIAEQGRESLSVVLSPPPKLLARRVKAHLDPNRNNVDPSCLPWKEPETIKQKEDLLSFLTELNSPHERDTLDSLFSRYRALPEPRLAYLAFPDINLLLSHFISVPVRTDTLMLRYMSIIDDMRALRIPLTRVEWVVAISFVAQRFNVKIGVPEIEAALRLWAEAEAVAGAESGPTVFNILLDMASNGKQPELINAILKEMENRGIAPDRYTHTTMMTWYGYLKDADNVRTTFSKIVQTGEVVDTVIFNALITALIRSLEFRTAEGIFERMKLAAKNFHAYLRNIAHSQGQEELPTMPPPISPSLQPYSSRKLGKTLKFMALKHQQRSSDKPSPFPTEVAEKIYSGPNIVTYNIFLHSYCRHGNLDKVHSLLAEMREFNIRLELSIFISLARGFTMHGQGRLPHSKWTRERLEEVYEAMMRVLRRKSYEGPAQKMNTVLACEMIKAFAATTMSRRRTVGVYRDLERLYEKGLGHRKNMEPVVLRVLQAAIGRPLRGGEGLRPGEGGEADRLAGGDQREVKVRWVEKPVVKARTKDEVEEERREEEELRRVNPLAEIYESPTTSGQEKVPFNINSILGVGEGDNVTL